MSNLMQKLSVLVKATLNDTSGADHAPGESRRDGGDVRARLRRDLPELQRRLDDALAYERTLVQRIETLEDEISRARGEQQAALQDGLNERARVVGDAVRRAENRLDMTRSDLREHKASALQLEAAVFELEQILERQGPGAEQPASAARAAAALDTLSDFLRRARERFAAAGDVQPAQDARASTENPLPPAAPPPSSQAEDDDMARRLSRLSKR
jgi:chromosome segregation ATPase